MRLYFISLHMLLIIFFASNAHAGMFDKILNNVKKSPGAVIDAIDKTIDNQKSSPATKTTHVEAPVKTAAKPAKSYDPVLVKNIQTRLNQLGYGAGKPDGVYGNNTRRAIQDFEKQQGFAATGEPTQAILTRLDQAVQAKPKPNTGSSPPVLAISVAGKSTSSEQIKEETKDLLNTKERKMVYEECVSDHRISFHFDCECLAEKAAAMYPQINTEMTLKMRMNEYGLAVSREGSCRNITAAVRGEYATCMTGTGFDYRGIPQEDYCECYAETWGKLYEEYEGRLDENTKSNLKLKARMQCYK